MKSKSTSPHRPTVKNPPCAGWNIWIGPEIEGSADIGEKTLFIRKLPASVTPATDFSFMLRGGCRRVWLCKELLHWASDNKAWSIIKNITSLFEKVCIEVEPEFLTCVPLPLREKARIYVKLIQIELKPGDVVCVGPSYNDEAFEMGTGVKVKPEQYLRDTKIA